MSAGEATGHLTSLFKANQIEQALDFAGKVGAFLAHDYDFNFIAGKIATYSQRWVEACRFLLRAVSARPFSPSASGYFFFVVTRLAPPDMTGSLVEHWLKAFHYADTLEAAQTMLAELHGGTDQAYEPFVVFAFMAWMAGKPERAVELFTQCLGSAEDGCVPIGDSRSDVVLRYYDDNAITYDDNNFHVDAANGFIDFLLVALAGMTNAEIIDVACGTGLVGAGLRPLASRLTGIDLSPQMLEGARRSGHYDALISGDMVGALEAYQGEADVIDCMGATYYLLDLAPFLRACARILRPGGRLVFTEYPAAPGSQTMVTLGGVRRYCRDPNHVRRLCAEAGLIERTVEIRLAFMLPAMFWCFEKAP